MTIQEMTVMLLQQEIITTEEQLYGAYALISAIEYGAGFELTKEKKVQVRDLGRIHTKLIWDRFHNKEVRE